MVEVTSFKLWACQIIILSGLLAFFIWLGIRPKSPSYTITQFSLQNGTIPFALEIENPNKDSDKGDNTPEIGSLAVVVSQRKKLEDEISNQKAQLKVVLVTRIQYRTWGIKSRRHKMQLDAQLPVGTDGKIPGKTKLHVSWKKWRTRSM